MYRNCPKSRHPMSMLITPRKIRLISTSVLPRRDVDSLRVLRSIGPHVWITDYRFAQSERLEDRVQVVVIQTDLNRARLAVCECDGDIHQTGSQSRSERLRSRRRLPI